jgi:hypothetical protein
MAISACRVCRPRSIAARIRRCTSEVRTPTEEIGISTAAGASAIALPAP